MGAVRKNPKPNEIRTLVQAASRDAMREAVAALPEGTWLTTNNRYGSDAAATVGADTKAGLGASDSDLAAYIAASSPLHTADGWGYLGRALDAHAHGDRGVARHLGYYAELRAAMGLLATEGICVLNYTHAVLNDARETTTFSGGGTHRFAWAALDIWSGTSAASELLGRIIAPESIDITTWVKALPHGGAWTAVGT